MDNQKNGTRGATIHHTAVPGPFCPVKALARRVHFLITHAQDNRFMPLSFAGRRQNGAQDHVLAGDITKAIEYVTAKTGLLLQGYILKRVSSHSLRASGAMALNMNGADDATIMRLGRWTSLTFMMYIHTQIAAFSAGWAERMSRPIRFDNMG